MTNPPHHDDAEKCFRPDFPILEPQRVSVDVSNIPIGCVEEKSDRICPSRPIPQNLVPRTKKTVPRPYYQHHNNFCLTGPICGTRRLPVVHMLLAVAETTRQCFLMGVMFLLMRRSRRTKSQRRVGVYLWLHKAIETPFNFTTQCPW